MLVAISCRRFLFGMLWLIFFMRLWAFRACYERKEKKIIQSVIFVRELCH